jgi:mRNA interferase MazF
MPIMTVYNFGDILLVPFPFTNQQSGKKRPAVVISNATYNQVKSDVIIMAVTSQLQRQSLGEVEVDDWQAAGLLKPSVIKPVITTIEKRLIIRMLGKLKLDDQRVLQQVIKTIIG